MGSFTFHRFVIAVLLNVGDEIQEGDEIKVKVIDVDQQGKVKLSRKEALKDGLEATPTT